MWKKILKLLAIISLLGLTLGCGGSKKVPTYASWYNEASNTGKMITVYNMAVNVHQLDSICVVDGLPQNLAMWNSSFYINYESRDTVYKYTFFRNQNELYIISEFRDSLSIHKQITK